LSDIVEKRITLPFQPRSYQLPLLQALEGGKKRAATVWHRRAGKDLTCWNYMISQAIERVGIYYFFYPTYTQGKKILWLGIDSKGKRFRDYIPQEIRERTKFHETELRADFPNGSIVQIVGSDNIDSIVGTNPIGCVFSEYALQDPKGWDYVRPILNENGGWAAFIYTPRGNNHGKRLYFNALKNPDRWFTQLLTIEDTRRDAPGETGSPVVTPEQVEAEIEDGMDEDLAQQEFYCSWAGIIQGNYYSRQLQRAEADGRITFTPYDPNLPVHTAWDLGFDDATTVWFVQVKGPATYVIDYYEDSGESLVHHVEEIYRRPYKFGLHLMPHDYEAHELGSGMTRRETVEQAHPNFASLTVKKLKVHEGIDASRKLIPRCQFDPVKCERGLDAMGSYIRQWDEKNNCYKNKPLHNWASHGADAFRTLALGIEDLQMFGGPRQTHADSAFNPYSYEEHQERQQETDSEFNVFAS
jgi:hypothetical protein